MSAQRGEAAVGAEWRDKVGDMPAASRTRVTWADLAKGVCIVLVVLRHVTNKQYRWMDWSGPAASVVDRWQQLSLVLQPLRMPLFFLLSGWFVASWLARPLGRYLERRVLRPWYLFVAWISVHGIWWLIVPPIHGVNRVEHWSQVPLELVWASSGVWYLYALAAYALVARATHTAPAPLVIAAAATVAVIASADVLGPLDGDRAAVLANLVFFLIGARLPTLVHRIGELAARSSLAATLVVMLFVAASVAAIGYDLHGLGHAPGTLLVLSTLGVTAGIAAAVRADLGSPTLSRRGSWLGARTLQIYVLHVPLVALLDLALRRSGVAAALTSAPTPVSVAAALAYPLVATALLIVVSLGIERALRRPAPWLFELPTPLRFSRLRPAPQVPSRRRRRFATRAASAPPDQRAPGSRTPLPATPPTSDP